MVETLTGEAWAGEVAGQNTHAHACLGRPEDCHVDFTQPGAESHCPGLRAGKPLGAVR